MSKRLLSNAVWMLAWLIVAGCGAGAREENRSTLSTQDPARAEKAQAETAAAAAAAREAEARAIGDVLKAVESP